MTCQAAAWSVRWRLVRRRAQERARREVQERLENEIASVRRSAEAEKAAALKSAAEVAKATKDAEIAAAVKAFLDFRDDRRVGVRRADRLGRARDSPKAAPLGYEEGEAQQEAAS